MAKLMESSETRNEDEQKIENSSWNSKDLLLQNYH